MFCPNCGKQHDDNARFCGECGTPFPGTVVTGAAPQASAPVNFNLKDIMKFVAAGIAVLALIMVIINVFSTFDVTATVSYGGMKESDSGPVADIIESEEFPMILIGNLLFGLANLPIAALAALYFLNEMKIANLYETIYAKNIKFSPFLAMGVVGAGAALVQIVCYLISTQKMFGATMSIAAPWTTWLMLFVYGGLAALSVLVLDKKQAPAAPIDPAV